MHQKRLLGLMLGVLSFAVGAWATLQFMDLKSDHLSDRPQLDEEVENSKPLAVPPASLSAQHSIDWPRFRGAEYTGASGDARPPIQWSQKEGILWKTALPGPGSSSPIVAGNRVYVTCYTGYGEDSTNPGSPEKLQRHLLCIDRQNGKILWTGTVAGNGTEDPYRGFITEHGYSSSTPAVDADGIYAFFGKSGVTAFSLDGKKLWQTSVGTESDDRHWGSCASVLLYNDLVIVNAASEARAVVALDKKTGKEIWKASGKKLSLSFSTPTLVSRGPDTELVVAMPGETWGLNPQTGKLLWLARIPCGGNVCPAVIPGDGVVYVTGGFQTRGSTAITVGGKGDVSAKNILWSANTSSYVPTPALVGKQLLNVNEDGIAVCQNATTGEVIYEERLKVKAGGGRGSRPFYASPVVAQDHLYAVSRKSGVFVLKVGDAFELLATNPPLDDTDFNATPAVSGKQLFLRSNQFLYCIEGK